MFSRHHTGQHNENEIPRTDGRTLSHRFTMEQFTDTNTAEQWCASYRGAPKAHLSNACRWKRYRLYSRSNLQAVTRRPVENTSTKKQR